MSDVHDDGRDETDDAPLFDAPLSVINVGLSSFADPLEAAGVPVARVDYTPPARGDEALVRLLDVLTR